MTNIVDETKKQSLGGSGLNDRLGDYYEIDALKDDFHGWVTISGVHGLHNALNNLEALKNAPHNYGKKLRLAKIERVIVA